MPAAWHYETWSNKNTSGTGGLVASTAFMPLNPMAIQVTDRRFDPHQEQSGTSATSACLSMQCPAAEPSASVPAAIAAVKAPLERVDLNGQLPMAGPHPAITIPLEALLSRHWN
jgi:hypothetical protein